VDLLKAGWQRFSDRRGTTLAAAIGYRAIFALAPLLVVTVSGAGAVFGQQAASGLLTQDLAQVLGEQLAENIEQLLASAGDQAQAGWLGALILIWAGSGLFNELQGSMLSIFGLTRPEGIGKAVRQRLITLLAVVAMVIGFSIVVAMAAWIPLSGSVGAIAGTAGMLVLGLALGFRYLTRYRPSWPKAFIVAALTVLVMGMASVIVGFFVARGGGGSATGIAGSAVAVLLLVYTLASVFLLGAAMLREYELRGGP